MLIATLDVAIYFQLSFCIFNNFSGDHHTIRFKLLVFLLKSAYLMSKMDSSKEEDITELESYCVNCGKNGLTKLLVLRIPYFKEVIIMSFKCNECGFANNELQPAATIQERGSTITLTCKQPLDLNRQVVKSDYGEVFIPEIEFKIIRQPGLVTTIEGLIDRAIEGLTQTIQLNSDQNSNSLLRLNNTIQNLTKLKSLDKSFTFILNDPSGNSFVENLKAPKTDPQMEIKYYKRSEKDNILLGLFNEAENGNDQLDLKNEVLQFPATCYKCNAPCFTNMKTTTIPHFKEVILMATNCDSCGYRTNEVKSGQGVADKGIRITIKINNENDLKRDVVRSDTCAIRIPELEIDTGYSGSGRYTTVEGLIENIKDDLMKNPFIDGDSAANNVRAKVVKVVEQLNNVIGLTLSLDDPCGNSYVESATNVEYYERTFEQNEQLGLNDIKTD